MEFFLGALVLGFGIIIGAAVHAAGASTSKKEDI